MNNRKLILSFFLFVSGIVWFYGRTIFNYFYFNFYKFRQFQGVELAKDIVPVVLALIAFAILYKNARINTWMDEVVAELRKVTWPSRDDVVRSTTVVVACVIIASFILAGFDVIWGKITGLLLDSKG